MYRLKISILMILLPVIVFSKNNKLTLNDQEYFEMPGLNVMVFQDIYPEGHQSGMTIIQNGVRIASNGDLRLEPAPGQWDPVPKVRKRNISHEKNEILTTLSFPDSSRHNKGFNPMVYPDLHLNYSMRVIGEGKSIRIIVDLENPLPEDWVGHIGFNIELFPGFYFGKSWIMDDQTGIFPPQFNGPVVIDDKDNIQAIPLAEGNTLTVNPESEWNWMTIKSKDNDLQLLDGRAVHSNGWFIIRSPIPANKTDNALEWIITAAADPDYLYEPVIHISQLGYHPGQQKIAFVEMDPKEKQIQPLILERIGQDGQRKTVIKQKPGLWGQFLRYQYLQLDFSEINEPGLYQFSYGTNRSNPFNINNEIYTRHVWQPVLEYFLPVQMCHMKVIDRYRIWHGRCHMDDARMAPTNHIHFDGYHQKESTLTSYESGQHVPGLNVGGWHDAGDYDLRIESQAGTVKMLSHTYELFNVEYDINTIDQTRQLVDMHIPDGIPDVLQQIEHGVLSMIAGYRNFGQFYRGIVASTKRQYVLLGDGVTMTDNEIMDNDSNNEDDRWVFTQENDYRQVIAATAFACASRVLEDYNPDLSKECLEIAEKVYQPYEDAQNNIRFMLAAELWHTTENEKYRDVLVTHRDTLTKFINFTSRILARLYPTIDDEGFRKDIRLAMETYKNKLDAEKKKNPFGLSYRPHIWGHGWNIQQSGVTRYFLHKAFPDLFPADDIYNALHFILGNHPGPNTASFASGVGAKSVTVAYGVNRADWSFIPGGVVSGTALIRPDFLEMKEWPFFWQQTEYVIGGGATNFMFLVLAVDDLLN